MQRLRGLKQLGVSEMTYVPTTHCRFEHSLGVAHLAKKVLLAIAKKQPRLEITEKDIVCVKLAGLLHDIGHGPFSHVYDGQFRTQLRRAEKEGVWLGQKIDKEMYDSIPVKSVEGWEHEDGSLMMIDALLCYLGLEIDEENLDLPLKQVGDGINAQCFGIYDFALSQEKEGRCYDGTTPLPDHLVLTSRDWIFIKECIVGGPLPPKGLSVDAAKKSTGLLQSYIGRPNPHKEFLYDVVSNRHSGLDVDKIDYLARDERRAFGTAGQIDPQFIENAYVAWGECPRPEKCFRCKHYINRKMMSLSSDMTSEYETKHLMICYPEKMVQNAMNFFKSRFRNHEKLYTHANTSASSIMVCDILLLADPYIRLSTESEGDGTTVIHRKNGNLKTGEAMSLPISRANLNPQSYLRLKDSILDIIEVNTSPELAPARKLLNRFRAHKIYKKVAECKIISSDGKSIDMPWQRILWEMGELEMSKEIVQCGQLHQDSTINLKEDDIIIEKRSIHHGMKAENPVSQMRFLPKTQLSKLRENAENLPVAWEIDEKEYECCIPRAFLQRTLRVYCRDFNKDTSDFLTTCYHQFIQTIKKRNANNGAVYNNDFDEPVLPQANVAVLSQSPFRGSNDAYSLNNNSNLSMGFDNERGERRGNHKRRKRASIYSRLNLGDSP